MRVIAFVLLLATVGFGVFEFRTQAALRTSTAKEQVLAKMEDRIREKPQEQSPIVAAGPPPGEAPRPAVAPPPPPAASVPPEVTEEKTQAHAERATALKDATVATYMRIGLTAVLVPFCMFLVLKRSKDTTAKTFSFTSLGVVLAYWLHSATP